MRYVENTQEVLARLCMEKDTIIKRLRDDVKDKDERYQNLLTKFQTEMRKNAELERTCKQQADQLDNQNEMIANLIKDRRERNWLLAGDNSVSSY